MTDDNELIYKALRLKPEHIAAINEFRIKRGLVSEAEAMRVLISSALGEDWSGVIRAGRPTQDEPSQETDTINS